MALELFTDPRLPCPQRVHLVLLELGLDVIVHRVSLEDGENRRNDYIQLNPFSTLPCLKDSSFSPPLVVYESRAIARFLAARYGPQLLPDPGDITALAQFEQAASIEVTTFDPVANRLVFEKIFKRHFKPNDPLPDLELVQELRSRLDAVFDVLETILVRQTYMAGESLSVVDLFYMPYFHHLEATVSPGFLHSRKNLARWWSTLKTRECYRALTGV
ncbi:glutathione S-transferase [Aspergillus keveii]|uniref:glutathione transferase n=1 Tax=Aspergillus keveii TaxID=714993 RepID=A0ABR4G212_9EURO